MCSLINIFTQAVVAVEAASGGRALVALVGEDGEGVVNEDDPERSWGVSSCLVSLCCVCVLLLLV